MYGCPGCPRLAPGDPTTARCTTGRCASHRPHRATTARTGSNRPWPPLRVGAWVPDGSAILFTPGSGNTDAKTFIIDADGTNLRLLSDIEISYLAWPSPISPDGTRVMLGAHPDVTAVLVIYDLTDDTWVHLTSSAWYGSWSPDGTRVAYAYYAKGTTGHWVSTWFASTAPSALISRLRCAHRQDRPFSLRAKSPGHPTARKSPCGIARTSSCTLSAWAPPPCAPSRSTLPRAGRRLQLLYPRTRGEPPKRPPGRRGRQCRA